MSYMYYNKQGKPLPDVISWAKLIKDRDYQIVKQEYTPKKVFWVSTVWLGINHNFVVGFELDSRPIIFETMVFDERPENAVDIFGKKLHGGDEILRASTEEEALANHQRLLEEYTRREAETSVDELQEM